MDPDSLPPIARLEHDHAILREELGRFSALLKELEQGEGFDELDTLYQVIRFEAEHHFPFEESLIAERLGAHSKALAAVRRQHSHLRASITHLMGLIECVRDDVLVDKEELLRSARTVIADLDAHIAHEDVELVPVLEADEMKD